MSHDRGCFKCHEDPSEYANCARAGCPKRQRFAVEPGGDKSDAPVRPLTLDERSALGMPHTLTEQERAQFPREAVLEADLAVARDELARRARPTTSAFPPDRLQVGDPGYRSGGDAAAKLHDAEMAPIRRRERGLPEGVTQADLDAATPLPPLGDSRRTRPADAEITASYTSRLRPRGRVTRIITVTEPGYDVALFMNEDGGAEAVITRPGLSPTGVNIAPPEPGRRIVIERVGEKFEVVYKDVL